MTPFLFLCLCRNTQKLKKATAIEKNEMDYDLNNKCLVSIF